MLQEISGEAFQLTEKVESAHEQEALAPHVQPKTHWKVQPPPGKVYCVPGLFLMCS